MISNVNQIIKNYSILQPCKPNQELVKSSDVQLSLKPAYLLTSNAFYNKVLLVNFIRPITFSGKIDYNGFEKIKDIKDLPCPCCGRKMVTPAQLYEFVDNLKEAHGNDIIENLDKYSDRLPESRIELFRELKQAAKNNRNLSLNELLLNLKDDSLDRLEKKQIKILEDISNLVQDLKDTRVKNNIIEYVNKTSERITQRNEEELFSRKSFVHNINKHRNRGSAVHRDIEILDSILETAMKLPSSTTDKDAFVVKYSRRDNKNIALNLLLPACSTIEHIKPASEKVPNLNHYSNLLVECKECNNKRGTIPFAKWVEEHTKMPQNSQRYINAIITHIKRNKILELAYYPEKVKQVLYKESNKKIDLNISQIREFFRKEKAKKQDSQKYRFKFSKNV